MARETDHVLNESDICCEWRSPPGRGWLAGIDRRLVEEAMRPGHQLVARIRLTGTAGEPGLTWSAEPASL
jgi:hypothetical protein